MEVHLARWGPRIAALSLAALAWGCECEGGYFGEVGLRSATGTVVVRQDALACGTESTPPCEGGEGCCVVPVNQPPNQAGLRCVARAYPVSTSADSPMETWVWVECPDLGGFVIPLGDLRSAPPAVALSVPVVEGVPEPSASDRDARAAAWGPARSPACDDDPWSGEVRIEGTVRILSRTGGALATPERMGGPVVTDDFRAEAEVEARIVAEGDSCATPDLAGTLRILQTADDYLVISDACE